MTKKEAAILTGFTGLLIGDFPDFHKYAEDIMGRSVWTHEFGNAETMNQIKEKATPDFIKICKELVD